MVTTTDFSRALGGHLADVMSERGITQVMVARELDRTQGYVSHRLNGRRAPETDLIVAIARLVGLTPRGLMAEVLARMDGGHAAQPGDTSAVPSRPAH